MRRRPPGTYVEVATAGERFRAFVPSALPPAPPVHWSAALRRRFDDSPCRARALDVTRRAAAAARNRPTTVAVHDNGDVNTGWPLVVGPDRANGRSDGARPWPHSQTCVASRSPR